MKLNGEYISLLEKQNSGSQEKINVRDLEDRVHTLEVQAHELTTENKSIQLKIDHQDLQVKRFVDEMNILLDHSELYPVSQNMDVESGPDFEEEDEEEEEFDYLDEDEGRAHHDTHN